MINCVTFVELGWGSLLAGWILSLFVRSGFSANFDSSFFF